MTITTMENSADFWSVIEAAKRLILISHVKPDGDTLGSASAFFSVGTEIGKQCRWGGRDPFPGMYAFLPHAQKYEQIESLGEFAPTQGDVVIALDTSTRDRSVTDLDLSPVLLNIDHHHDNSLYGDIVRVDSGASSTAELLWNIFSSAPIPLISYEAAFSLYVGVATDSGSFSFSCTTSRTHMAVSGMLEKGVRPAEVNRLLNYNRSYAKMRLWGLALSRITVKGTAAMTWLVDADFRNFGADPSETENLVNQLLLIRDVELALLLIDHREGVRVSIRSEGAVSAAAIAHRFGGGGHPQAAGCTLSGTLSSATDRLFSAIDECVRGDERLSAPR